MTERRAGYEPSFSPGLKAVSTSVKIVTGIEVEEIRSEEPRENWIENVVKKFDFNELTIKNSKVERLVKASLEGKDTKVRALAKEIGAEYYGK